MEQQHQPHGNIYNSSNNNLQNSGLVGSNKPVQPQPSGTGSVTNSSEAMIKGEIKDKIKDEIGNDVSKNKDSTTMGTSTVRDHGPEITDQAVLEYLRSKGMGSAVLELSNILEGKSSSAAKATEGQDFTSRFGVEHKKGQVTDPMEIDGIDLIKSNNKEEHLAKTRERLEKEEIIHRNQRTLLTKSTGGHYGYDRDSAWPVVQWGVPDTTDLTLLESPDAVESSVPSSEEAVVSGGNTAKESKSSKIESIGVVEARAYVNAFVSLQLWVMTLPDHDGIHSVSYNNNPLKRAHDLLEQHKKMKNNLKTKKTDNDYDENIKLENEGQETNQNKDYANETSKDENESDDELLKNIISEVSRGVSSTNSVWNFPSPGHLVSSNLPPSAKQELLAITFALLVYTYCELLEHGMQSTAHSIRDAFKPIYEPYYMTQYRDLYQCTTTDDMMRLNLHNSQHIEMLSGLKEVLVQIAQCQLRRQELDTQMNDTFQQLDATQKQLNAQAIEKYDAKIKQLSKKHEKLSQRAVSAFEKIDDVPFLRCARASRWQLTMSTTTYGLLTSFLNTSSDKTLICMSTILQTKCELHVENRPPLPFTPACIFNEQSLSLLTPGTTIPNGSTVDTIKALDLNSVNVSWTAPAPRLLEENAHQKLNLSFPKFHLDDEYDNEYNAAIDKERVEFNRALLINGFRRLEALERKREYEVLPLASQKRLRDAGMEIKKAANPFEPTILMATLCCDSYSPGLATPVLRPKPTGSRQRSVADSSSLGWEEAGIGMCCAKLSPPDGRRVAVGCDDAAIRIWSAVDGRSIERGDEPLQVLLGHKNGLPVVDVDWNRDGRTLLSSGCDGSIRLWDTMAVGPFGEVTTALSKKGNTKIDASKNRTSAGINDKNNKNKIKIPPPLIGNNVPDMSVPGLRPESGTYTCGAALAVYRGHVTGSPVWSVAFSPAGYYFASAGADATARLWTTDRPQPVRLFTGHTSANVNCVEWHPNCNYIITGSDDTTVRLWDVQTGRTVRILSGCTAGINTVQISPSGRYATASDYSGTVHLWDLGTSKKITEFRTIVPSSSAQTKLEKKSPRSGSANNTTIPAAAPMIHCIKFSACGTALATGGSDCTVRIWDVRSDALAEKSFVFTPHASFLTKQTVLMDFFYTRRNLLITVGKFVVPSYSSS